MISRKNICCCVLGRFSAFPFKGCRRAKKSPLSSSFKSPRPDKNSLFLISQIDSVWCHTMNEKKGCSVQYFTVRSNLSLKLYAKS